MVDLSIITIRPSVGFLAPEVTGSGVQLISIAGRHKLVIQHPEHDHDWLMAMYLACVTSKGRGSHDLNCPMTIDIVVRLLYLGGLLYKECVNRDSNDCLVDRGRL